MTRWSTLARMSTGERMKLFQSHRDHGIIMKFSFLYYEFFMYFYHFYELFLLSSYSCAIYMKNNADELFIRRFTMWARIQGKLKLLLHEWDCTWCMHSTVGYPEDILKAIPVHRKRDVDWRKTWNELKGMEGPTLIKFWSINDRKANTLPQQCTSLVAHIWIQIKYAKVICYKKWQ